MIPNPFLYFLQHLRSDNSITRYYRFNVNNGDTVMIEVDDVTGETKTMFWDKVKLSQDLERRPLLHKISDTHPEHEVMERRLQECLESQFLIHFEVKNDLKIYEIASHL